MKIDLSRKRLRIYHTYKVCATSILSYNSIAALNGLINLPSTTVPTSSFYIMPHSICCLAHDSGDCSSSQHKSVLLCIICCFVYQSAYFFNFLCRHFLMQRRNDLLAISVYSGSLQITLSNIFISMFSIPNSSDCSL